MKSKNELKKLTFKSPTFEQCGIKLICGLCDAKEKENEVLKSNIEKLKKELKTNKEKTSAIKKHSREQNEKIESL